MADLDFVLDEALDKLVGADELQQEAREGVGRSGSSSASTPPRPTSTSGFAVVLRKLRQFQELGHTAVLIIGDFTAQVGDPSGRSVDPAARSRRRRSTSTRRPTSSSCTRSCCRNRSRSVATPSGSPRWTSKTCCGSRRARPSPGCSSATTSPSATPSGQPISVMEFLYPLLQGWDSVMVEADVELGGTDQLFNFLMARQLQEQEGQEPQVVLTMPLLVGLDGVQKMSKSLGNYVGIAEPPAEQFGKLMSLPDELMPQYFELATGVAARTRRRGDPRAGGRRAEARRGEATARAHRRRPVPRRRRRRRGRGGVRPRLRRARGTRRRPRGADPTRRPA